MLLPLLLIVASATGPPLPVHCDPKAKPPEKCPGAVVCPPSGVCPSGPAPPAPAAPSPPTTHASRTPPSALCAAQLDEFCSNNRTHGQWPPKLKDCYHEAAAAHVKVPLLAAFSSSNEKNAPVWRCYSPSALAQPDPATVPIMQRTRAPGHQFYCTFDAQLRAVLQQCDPGWVPPPPPPPPLDIVFEGDLFGGPSLLYVPPGAPGADAQNGTLLIFSTSDHQGKEDRGQKLPLWSLLAKRSTNHGISWSDALQVAPPSAGHYLPASPQSVYDAKTRSIILQFGNNSMQSTYMKNSSGEGGIRSLRSTDCGKSWFGFLDVTAQLATTIGDRLPSTAVSPTSGSGVVMRPVNGSYGGRIVFCSTSAPYRGVLVTMTDDGGYTYNASAALYVSGLDECQIAQATNGSLILFDRNCDWENCIKAPLVAVSDDDTQTSRRPLLPPGNPHRFAVSYSHDGGMRWTPLTYQAELVTPTCQMAAISYKGPRDKDIALYFAQPYSETKRENGTILASDDSGRTWTRKLTLGPSDDGSMAFGYSGLQCGLVGAADGCDCAVVYRSLHYTIRFKRFKSWEVAKLKSDDAGSITCNAKLLKFPVNAPRADLVISNNSRAFDSYNLMSPFVAQMDTGQWHMYYGGGPATNPSYLRYQLGLATAPGPDGPWTRHGKPLLPLGSADNFMTTPTLLRDEKNAVLREAGLLHMLFPGNRNQTMYHATSVDGVAWQMDPRPIFRGYAPSVLRVDGLLHLFYINTWAGGLWRVELATGRDWRSLSFKAIVLDAKTQQWESGNLFYPFAVYTHNTAKPWMLWWSSYARRTECRMPPAPAYITAIGLAFGTSDLNFTKCAQNPLLVPTNGSSYDSVYVGSPSLVTSNASGAALEGGPRLYYAGRIDKYHKYYSLAHATLGPPQQRKFQ